MEKERKTNYVETLRNEFFQAIKLGASDKLISLCQDKNYLLKCHDENGFRPLHLAIK